MKSSFYLIFSIIALNLIFGYAALHGDSYKFNALGKSYEVVKEKKSWQDAAEYAKNLGGYLIEVNSADEQQALWEGIINGAQIDPTYVSIMDGGGSAYLWIGANDIANEGKWIWDGDNDGSGENFWEGKSSSGNIVNDSYVNWGGSSRSLYKEPDDYNNSQDGAAIALQGWPKGMNTLGIEGEWNDINITNKIFFVIEYDYAGKPGKCSVPQGETNLCLDPEDTEYTTEGKDDAQSYVWNISPQNAGEILGEDVSAIVDWNPDFTGDAEITVYAVNPLGEGEVSDPVIVTINPLPEKTDKPSGANELCKNPENSAYTINESEGADTYLWQISPEEAGEITANGTEAEVDWTDDFTGTAVVSVSSQNECGSSEESIIEISVYDVPEIPSAPTGESQLSVNPPNTFYSIESVPNADSYTWRIQPAEAGEITGSENNAEVDWTDDFTGTAVIDVSAENSCGESSFSDGFSVIISETNSVNESSNNFLEIYPNPSSGLVNIKNSTAGEYTVSVCDVLGREILNKTYFGGEFSFEINRKGVFFMRINTASDSKTTFLLIR